MYTRSIQFGFAMMLVSLFTVSPLSADTINDPSKSYSLKEIEIHSVAFSGDMTKVLAASGTKPTIFDRTDPTSYQRVGDHGVNAYVRSIFGYPTASWVGGGASTYIFVTGSDNGYGYFWLGGTTPATAAAVSFNHGAAVRCAATNQLTFAQTLTCGTDGIIKLWETGSGTLIKQFDDPDSSKTVCWVDISPTEKNIASVGEDQYIKLWGKTSGKLLWKSPKQGSVGSGHTPPIMSVQFSPLNDSGKTSYVAASGLGNVATLWHINESDIANDTYLYGTYEHSKTVTSVCFSPGRRLLYTGSLDGTVKCWEIARSSLVRTYNVGLPVMSLSCSKDESLILVGGTTSAGNGYAREYAAVPIGSIKVVINPKEAITAGAQWKINDIGWNDSGETFDGFPAMSSMSHNITFRNVSGWNPPASLSVTLTAGKTLTKTVTYTAIPGNLQVTITPQAAIDAGAKWRITGTSTWRDSGYIETEVSVGEKTVEFCLLSGWIRPSNKTVTITAGGTATTTGNYEVIPATLGNLQVTITPATAISAGAQWRILGTNIWRDSGYTESDLLAENVTIEFSDVCGWYKPSDVFVTIQAGNTLQKQGTYFETTDVNADGKVDEKDLFIVMDDFQNCIPSIILDKKDPSSTQ